MKFEAIRIRNYRALQDVTLKNLPGLCAFVGANGVGKSTLFDVFGFLHDALIHNVTNALARRGGFKEVVSRGQDGPISFELKFRQPDGPLVTYQLQIGLEEGRPVVEREVLKYRRGQYGQPWHFLDFTCGKGLAVTNEADYGKPDVEMERDEQELESPDILAVKGLGQFQRFKQVVAFRRLIEGWHVSDFHISAARPSQEAGLAEHLSERGDNLPLVARFMYDHHRDVFNQVLDKMAERVPGVSRVEAVDTEDGRVVLRFQDGAFRDPFVAKYVSDGTIKMFAYLLLLFDPRPHPLLCIEEPENQLHPELLFELSEEFRAYSQRGGQVFVSTHSPDLLNGLELEEIFWLARDNGYARVHRATTEPLMSSLVEQGDLPGALWKQGLLEGSGPR